MVDTKTNGSDQLIFQNVIQQMTPPFSFTKESLPKKTGQGIHKNQEPCDEELFEYAKALFDV